MKQQHLLLKSITPIFIFCLFFSSHIEARADIPTQEQMWQIIQQQQQAIAELYFSLEDDSERLGPDLISTWEILQKMIKKVQ